MHSFIILIPICVLAAITYGFGSCQKNQNCAKKLEGTWSYNHEGSKVWLDGVLVEDTSATTDVSYIFTHDGYNGGSMNIEVIPGWPNSFRYDILEDCSIFNFGKTETGTDPDFPANIQKLTNNQFIYDYENIIGDDLWSFEVSLTKQE